MKVVVHRPQMWASVFRKFETWNQTKNRNGNDHVNVTFQPLDVDRGYQRIREQVADGDACHVLVLPIAHCVSLLHAETELSLLGIATKTRNDIYAYRKRNRDTDYLSPTNRQIRIGVPEIHITTADICRTVLRRWSPDLFSLFDVSRLDSNIIPGILQHDQESLSRVIREFCNNHVRHYQVPDESDRLERLLMPANEANALDVAVFMGAGLEKKALCDAYHRQVIDGANLNNIVNNIYNTSLFPRTVYAVYDKQYDLHRKVFNQFSNTVNRFVASKLEKRHALKQYRLPWSRIQCLSQVGSAADPIDILTGVTFTRDICDRNHWSMFYSDFSETDRLQRQNCSRPIELDDFVDLPQELRNRRGSNRGDLVNSACDWFSSAVADKLPTRSADFDENAHKKVDEFLATWQSSARVMRRKDLGKWFDRSLAELKQSLPQVVADAVESVAKSLSKEVVDAGVKT